MPSPLSMPRRLVTDRIAQHLRVRRRISLATGAVFGSTAIASPAFCRTIFTTIRHSPTSSSWLPPILTKPAVIFLHFSSASGPS